MAVFGLAADVAHGFVQQDGDLLLLLAVGGAVTGVLFGFFAQRSRFCLRAAVIEFWHGRFGERLSVWLLAFSTALVVVQALILAGGLDVDSARQLANRGSLSGALVGGLLFGAGMIMTRGCASRLLVLSANGNLRALLSGLVFAVTAQAALAGALAPLRTEISSWWTVDGGAARSPLARVGAVRDDAQPRVSVQVGGYVSAYWMDDSYYGGLSNPRIALGMGVGRGGFGFGMGWPLSDPSIPAYVSEVNLLMRDLQTGQIVYDTRARHDGPWHDTDNVLAALFVAALEGYPQPAMSVRRVGVPLVPVTAAPAPALPTRGAAPMAPGQPAPAFGLGRPGGADLGKGAALEIAKAAFAQADVGRDRQALRLGHDAVDQLLHGGDVADQPRHHAP